MTVDQATAGAMRGERLLRAMRQINRQPETGGKAGRTAKVITVFMRQQDGINAFRSDVQTGQTLNRHLEGKATIEQHPRIADIDNQGVAPTAAAQRGKTHHFNCS